ncbi:beta-propeller fold lactonase family protein [Chloroflexi bacterium TSY]|nr:beta-propeller fold lactonase family protein [Chloroflexi bacterium TSY]
MSTLRIWILPLLFGLIFGLLGIPTNPNVFAADLVGVERFSDDDEEFEGAVYVMTNKQDANTIVAYGRLRDGSLRKIGEFPTGGMGTGPLHPPALDESDMLDPLISANALIRVDEDFVLAVNAMSHTVSSLRVNEDYSLTLVNTVPSGGNFPNSIAFDKDLVYVTNIGTGEANTGNVSGFTINYDGVLSPIPNSTRTLSGPSARPSAVSFTPDGEILVVSELNTGNFSTFLVNKGLLSNQPVVAPPQIAEGRSDPNPIGFQIVQRRRKTFLIATEAREILNGQLNLQAGSVSTYLINGDGSLTLISSDERAGNQRTTCWIGVTPNLKFAYTSNAVDGSISAFRFRPNTGRIQLKKEIAAFVTPADGAPPHPATGVPTSGLIDLSISPDGRYLYQLSGLKGGVSVYRIQRNGTLRHVDERLGDLPVTGTQGIVSL